MAAILAYILLCLIWGSTWLFIRIGLQDMPPFTSLAIRLVPALLFLLILLWRRRTALRPLLSHPWRVLQVGLLVYPGSYGLVYWGEQHVSSGLAAVVFSVMPFFVALFAWRLLPGERAAPRAIVGLVLGFGGLVVIYWEQLTLGSTERLLGMLAITASALIAAFNTVTIRRWLGAIPAVALATWTVAAGAAIIPFYALLGESGSHVQWTPSAVGAALYLGVLGSGVSFVLYFHLLARISALTMSLITFVTPIIALTLGAFFDYEALGSRAWLGTGMVLGGVLLAALQSTRSARD
jgi:drug/metabolite transporter (DMT)-like permease